MSTTASPTQTHCRAWRSPLAWLVLMGVLASGLSLDLSLKYWSFTRVAPTEFRDGQIIIPSHAPVRVIPGVLNLHLVKNEGAVFGIGANQRMFFVVFTIGALAAALLVFARWTGRGASLPHVAIGLILAGGLGNLYDRLRFSVVRDFMHMLPGWKLPWGWHWPGCSTEIFPWVFNAADVMLLFGMGMLMLHINRAEKRRKLAKATTSQAPQQGQTESA